MSHLLDDDDALLRKERELTLSTGSILGLFFGLVLLCGLFFGLGYNVGNHKTPSPVAAGPDRSADTADSSASPDFKSFKPSAGLPSAGSTNRPPGAATTAAHTAADAGDGSTSSRPPGNTAGRSAAGGVETSSAAPAAHSPVRATAPTAPGNSSAATAVGSFIVQVAAVSHREDADLLITALKNRGYAVTARTAPQDSLIHIQVGPFSTHTEADAMRQRLLADGYNALVK